MKHNIPQISDRDGDAAYIRFMTEPRNSMPHYNLRPEEELKGIEGVKIISDTEAIERGIIRYSRA